MRGAIGRRLSNPNGFNLVSIVKRTPFLTQPTFHFSSSSSGAGRGRGRGGDGGYSAESGQFGINREPEKSSEAVTHDSWESPSAGYGHGRGRGRPISSDPIPPGISSIGRGRGAVKSDVVTPFSAGSPPNPQPQEQPQSQTVKPPVDVKQQEIKEASLSPPEPKSSKPALPSDLFNGLGSGISHSNQRIVPGSGAGRGKPMESAPIQQFQEENRHIRRPPPPQQQQSQPQQSQPPPQQQSQPPPQQQRQTQPQQKQRSQLQNQRAQTAKEESKGSPKPPFNAEEAKKRAMSALSRGEAEGSGVRGRVMRGGGRGRDRGRRGGEGWRDDKKEEDAEAEAINTFLGDSADGEKLANKVGPELMSKLAENFEDICDRALPSTANDAFLDAYETNLMIECEPEYLMPDFESNPDIDEKPPMSLRECLEKVKPFIVAYEGIKNQEEWEEAIDEVMARAPLIKEIVDHYSGPDQITAKKQNQELDRIATTIPKTAPDALKRFANRAALTLQSNPGWGYDKKYQFMDKLVRETSQDYK